MAALAVTWELRWLGADNIQAFILAPGSYLLLVGALLPADTRLNHPARLSQWISLTGAMVLMLPTLTQSFDGDQGWVYALVVAGEALVITAIGVGTRSRLLVLTGTPLSAWPRSVARCWPLTLVCRSPSSSPPSLCC